MSTRKRKNATFGLKVPSPYNPISGEHATLRLPDDLTRVAIFQVAEEDTHDDYLVCRGFDPTSRKFYSAMSVAKPYGVRGDNAYEIGQMLTCAKPLTKLGTNPGVAATTVGHPEDLDELIELLYDDDDGPIEWMEIGSAAGGSSRFYNDSDGAVSPYDLMAVTGVVDVGDVSNPDVILKADEPSTTFYRWYIVNGDSEVAAKTVGHYQDSEIVKVAYDSSTGTPAIGQGWGPKPGQWMAALNYPMTCSVAGIVDSDLKYMWVRMQEITELIGVLDGALETGDTATMEVFKGATEAIITGMTVTVTDYLLGSGEEIADGKKVIATCINGIWYATAAEC